MTAPHCLNHDDAAATHAVRLKGVTGLTMVCCKCAVDNGRSCNH